MTDNGAPQGVRVTCAKCGFAIGLSQEETFQFFGNFFCLRCGTRTGLPVSKEAFAALRRDNDRDRRPAGPPSTPAR